MFKNIIQISLIVFILNLTACKKQTATEETLPEVTTAIEWEAVSIQKLPFSFNFKYDSILDYYYTLDYFSKRKLIDTSSKLNHYFSDSTSFLPKEDLFITESKNYPYLGKGYFHKRLPDINKHKVMVFIYQNTQEEETLPYFELQTFNNENHVIDKIIIAGGINDDCSWDRKFSIDKNYIITITDKEACYDIEDEKEIGKRTLKTQYQIKEDGSIIVFEEEVVL